MEWPYDHPRRGDMPPTFHALGANEYTHPQAALRRRSRPAKKVLFLRPGLERLRLQQEHRRGREGASLHRHELRLGARARCSAARPTSGDGSRCGCRDYDFKAQVARRLRRGLADLVRGHRAVLRQVDLYLGISGVKEGLALPARQLFQRPTRLNAAEVQLRESLAKMGRVLTPYRAGVTTDGLKHNKYRSRCYGRGACNRRAGGCDIHAAFDSPTGLIYPADGHGAPHDPHQRDGARSHRRSRDRQGARRVVRRHGAPGRTYEAQGRRSSWSAASTLESARLLLLSKSPRIRTGSATRAATSATTSAST